MSWITQNAELLGLTAAAVVAYLSINAVIARVLRRAERAHVRSNATIEAIRAVRLVTAFFGLLAILVLWGIDFGSVAILATTTVTLLGVALFASWSLLSNVTAYFVLLFHPLFRRGRFIRVVDADNYVEGSVSDLRLFSLQLDADDGSTVVYPNNLLLSRIVVVDPPDRWNGIGKIVNPAIDEEQNKAAPR